MGIVKLTLTFEDEVIKKARKLGLNHYQVAENGFIDIIGRIEGKSQPNSADSSVNASSEEGLLVDRRGFEPLASAVRGRRSYH
jgi:hypothetical protein